MIRRWVFLEIGEATDAVIMLISKQFSAFADVSLALVALDLVGRVQDVLSGAAGT